MTDGDPFKPGLDAGETNNCAQRLVQPWVAADGGTAALCGSVAQSEVSGSAAPAAEPDADMICIANGCAKRTCKTRLLAQGLRKSSDSLICTQGRSEGLG